jgi:hypothetical protein
MTTQPDAWRPSSSPGLSVNMNTRFVRNDYTGVVLTYSEYSEGLKKIKDSIASYPSTESFDKIAGMLLDPYSDDDEFRDYL